MKYFFGLKKNIFAFRKYFGIVPYRFRNFHLFSHFPTSTKFWTLSQIVFMCWITPQLLFNWRSLFIFKEINPLWINNYTMLIKNYFFNSHTFTLGCILLILLITLAFYTYFIFNYHRFVLYNLKVTRAFPFFSVHRSYPPEYNKKFNSPP